MLKTKDLVGYYPFEGNADDGSGEGNNGTVNGATLSTGKFGKGYYFDGVNDFISTEITDGFNDKFTICMWVKSANTGSTEWMLGKYGAGTLTPPQNERQLALQFLSTDLLRFVWYGNVNGTVYSDIRSVNAIRDIGTWQHIAVTYDSDESINSRIKLYVNGEVVSQTVNNVGSISSIATSNSRISFGMPVGKPGSVYTSPTNLFKGDIDKPILIDGVVLSKSDIKRIMLNLHPII